MDDSGNAASQAACRYCREVIVLRAYTDRTDPAVPPEQASDWMLAAAPEDANPALCGARLALPAGADRRHKPASRSASG